MAVRRTGPPWNERRAYGGVALDSDTREDALRERPAADLAPAALPLRPSCRPGKETTPGSEQVGGMSLFACMLDASGRRRRGGFRHGADGGPGVPATHGADGRGRFGRAVADAGRSGDPLAGFARPPRCLGD